jgi:hypothetical protein
MHGMPQHTLGTPPRSRSNATCTPHLVRPVLDAIPSPHPDSSNALRRPRRCAVRLNVRSWTDLPLGSECCKHAIQAQSRSSRRTAASARWPHRLALSWTASAAWPIEQDRRAGERSSQNDEGPADRWVLRRVAPTSPWIVLKPVSETTIDSTAPNLCLHTSCSLQ